MYLKHFEHESNSVTSAIKTNTRSFIIFMNYVIVIQQ